MSENKLDKLTFIMLYNNRAQVFDVKRQCDGKLPGICESKPIHAGYVAHFCPERSLLLVERKLMPPHWLTGEWIRESELTTIPGLDITQAVDTISREWSKWREDAAGTCDINLPGGWVGERPDVIRSMDGEGFGEVVPDAEPESKPEPAAVIITPAPEPLMLLGAPEDSAATTTAKPKRTRKAAGKSTEDGLTSASPDWVEPTIKTAARKRKAARKGAKS